MMMLRRRRLFLALASAVIAFLLLGSKWPTEAAELCAQFGQQKNHLDPRSANPSEVGMDSAVLRKAVLLYDQAVARDDVRGAVLLVARQGKIVIHQAIGWRDHKHGFRMRKETLFHMGSNTKAVIATAVLMLVEDGKLDLDDPVRRHLPSFDNVGSKDITVRHLLTHTAGFRIPTIFPEPLLTRSPEHPDAPSLRAEADRLGVIGPRFPPGTSYSYSNPGYNILGALIEAVAAQPLDQFLTARIYKPLGMTSTFHQDRPKILKRRAVIYSREQGTWREIYRPGDPPEFPFVRASGGMITTAGDYARFLQMLLNGGTYGGSRLLKSASVQLAMTPQTRFLYSPDEQSDFDTFYGFGWQVAADGTCSHTGRHGTYAWVEPGREIVGIILTQSLGGTNPQEEFVRLVDRSTAVGGPHAKQRNNEQPGE